MKSKLKQSASFWFLSFLLVGQLALVVNISPAQALNVGDVPQEGFGQEEIPKTFAGGRNRAGGDIYKIAQDVINMALSVLGVIFLAIIIIAGYQYMTAGGNEEKVKDAISRIRNSVIGLIIIFMSWAITRFVINALVNATVDPW